MEKQIVSYTVEVETVKTNAHREKGLVMKAWQDFIKYYANPAVIIKSFGLFVSGPEKNRSRGKGCISNPPLHPPPPKKTFHKVSDNSPKNTPGNYILSCERTFSSSSPLPPTHPL